LRFATSYAIVDQTTISWMMREPRRPRVAVDAGLVRQPVPVELHISTVEPFRPTCWEYMGV